MVLIDFWTYSCINCVRTQPHLNARYDSYRDQGLGIIGVHAPGFAFEKDPVNVATAVRGAGIEYPVVLDLLVLPGIDGLEVHRRLRRDDNRAAVIILTGLRVRPDPRAEDRADEYLAKPLSVRDLVLRVESVLRRTDTASLRGAGRQLVVDGDLRLDPDRVAP